MIGFGIFFAYCLIGGVFFKLLYNKYHTDRYDMWDMNSFIGGIFWPIFLPFYIGSVLTERVLQYSEDKKAQRAKVKQETEKATRKRIKELEKIEEELEMELEKEASQYRVR